MTKTVRNKVKVDGDTRLTTVITSITSSWKRIATYWQLPCGCIGPDIWNSEDLRQAECTECGRGWKHMTTTCEMLDGKPQGQPVLVLTEKMMADAEVD